MGFAIALVAFFLVMMKGRFGARRFCYAALLSYPLLSFSTPPALIRGQGGALGTVLPTAAGQIPSADSPDTFDDISTRALAAREAGRLTESVELYRRALEMRPAWAAGWWYLGTILYELDRHDEGRRAFRHFVELEPENGPGWALLGLCEFKGREYDRALGSLRRARQLGIGGNPQIASVSNYHAALLLTRFQQFEEAFSILVVLAQSHTDRARIVEALGLSALRLPYLPEELPPDHREPVRMAGQACVLIATNRYDEAAAKFEELLKHYPDLPNVHYARGLFFLQTDPEAAIREFQLELAKSPHHLEARIQLAFEYLARGDPASGLPFAQEAVSLEPRSVAARYVLGRIHLEKGELDRAIQELEAGVELGPESPQLFFSLARAYSKAGREADAQKAKAEFLRLDELRRDKPSAPGPPAARERLPSRAKLPPP